MKTYLKQIAKKYLLKKGYAIVPIDDYKLKLDEVVYDWLKKINPRIIIDVGASNGGFAKKIRKILPQAQIFCFEPLQQPFNSLIESFGDDKYFEAFNIAVSNKRGESDFYECISSGSSSILEMAEVHKKAYPKTINSNKIAVKVDTLDNLLFKKLRLNEGGILLKIDVQGAEGLVLKGAEEILKLTDIIFIEVNFSETYKGCIIVNELVKILESFDFVLYGIENVSQSIYDGSFLQADAFFIKKHLDKIINADK